MVDEGGGGIVAEACDESDTNPTLHDVTGVIARTFERDPSPEPSQSAIVCTAEPCAMCASAIVWTEIRRVIFGTPSATLRGSGKLGIDLGIDEVIARSQMRGRIEVIGGVPEDECTALYAADP